MENTLETCIKIEKTLKTTAKRIKQPLKIEPMGKQMRKSEKNKTY